MFFIMSMCFSENQNKQLSHFHLQDLKRNNTHRQLKFTEEVSQAKMKRVVIIPGT
jgi:hypothetical protein